MKIGELELGTRPVNVLETSGIKTYEQLLKYDWRRFAVHGQCGTKTLADLAMAVIRFGSGKTLQEIKKFEKFRRADFPWKDYYKYKQAFEKTEKIKEIINNA